MSPARLGSATPQLLLLVLITGLALAVRAPGVSGFAVNHWDEGLAWSGARWFASFGAEGHYSPTHAPPLTSLSLALGSWLLSPLGVEGPVAGVWLVVMAGVLLVPAAFFLGRSVAGSRAGLGAAALIAVSPLHISFSRSLLTDTFYSLWLVLALALALSAMRRGGTARWLACGLAIALLQATKYNGFVLLGPIGLVGLWVRPRPWRPGELVRDTLALAGPPLAVILANLAALAALGKLDGFVAHYTRYIGDPAPMGELLGTVALYGLGGWPLGWLSALLTALLVGFACFGRPRGSDVPARSGSSVPVGAASGLEGARAAAWLLLLSLLLYVVFAARYTLFLRLLVPVVTLLLVILPAASRRLPGRHSGTCTTLLTLGLLVAAWLQPRYPVPAGFDGYQRAARELNALPPELPRLLTGQRFVWPELVGEVHHGSPASQEDLLDREEEVVVVLDLGSFSRLRDWDLLALHDRLRGEASIRGWVHGTVPATPGLDCLQNNLGLEGLERLRADRAHAERILGIHWYRLPGRELLALCRQ